MKKIGLISCFLMLTISLVFAQEKADKLFDKAMALAEEGNFKLANTQLQEAAKIYQEDGNMSMYYQALAEQGRNILDAGDGEKALTYLTELEEEAAKVFKSPDIAQALIQKYIGYVYYDHYGDNVAAYQPFKKALELRTKVNSKDEALFRDNYNIGVMCREIDRLKESEQYLKNALELVGDNGTDRILSIISVELAKTYNEMEDLGMAIDYINKALVYAEKAYGSESPKLAKMLLDKGAILSSAAVSIEDLSEAEKAILEGLEIYEKQEVKDYYNIAVGYSLLGDIYTAQLFEDIKASESALINYEKGWNIARQQLEDSPVKINLLLNLAYVNIHIGKLEAAEKYIEQIADLSDLMAPKGEDKSTYHRVKAQLALAKGDFEKAFTEINNSMVALIEGDYNLKKDEYPDLKSINPDKIVNLPELVGKIAHKILFYKKQYEESKNIVALENAYKHALFFDELLDMARTEFASSGAKMIWSDFVIDDFGEIIELCIALQKAKNDNSYLEKAYYFSEKSKGLLLLESFQTAKANKFAGLPETVLAEEEELRLAVSDAKQQLFQIKQAGQMNSDAYKAKQMEYLDKKEAYADFTKRIEKEHPDYYKMKYDVNILDVAATQEMLLEDQDLIEYYVSTDKIFAFKIGKSSLDVIEMKIEQDLLKSVKRFRESIYGYYLNAGERTEDGYEKYSNQYAELGYQMYQTLVKPLGDLKKRLIIIPAGALSNIPFEPMLMEKPKDPEAYKTHKYLTKEHIVAYNYSATLLSEMRNRDYGNNRETLLAIAPEFGTDAASFVRGKRFALAPLTFNTVEVENVKKMLGSGTLLMGQDALEPRFKEMGGDYKIIHFATHGMANDRDPDFSLLAFTEIPDSTENEFLYVSDLYNMELRTDLIVLSACETGLGELRRGEGVISLARGFAYAGTKSIFTTLWSVNDQATANIIEGFYRYLKAGKSKDEALQLAKIDFIEGGNNMTAHPFLWSPYIFIGDSSPMHLGGGIPWLYIGIGGLAVLLLVGGFLMLKKGKRKEEVV